jgi:hypothetical protein
MVAGAGVSNNFTKYPWVNCDLFWIDWVTHCKRACLACHGISYAPLCVWVVIKTNLIADRPILSQATFETLLYLGSGFFRCE